MTDKKHNLNTIGIEIIGWGHYLPKRLVTNEEVNARITLETSSVDEKVIGNVGVSTRYWADEEETVQFMSKMSGEEALQNAGVRPEEIDLLILENWTERKYVPDLAPSVASAIGAKNAMAFDMCTACCGFTTASTTASMYLLAHPRVKKVLVICTEQFSHRVRPGSKGELIVGDASAAFVLQRNKNTNSGIIDFELGNDGDLKDVVKVKMPEGWIKSKPELAQVAADLNKRAIDAIFQRNHISVKDIDWYVPHPGTQVVHEEIKNYIGLPEEKFIINFDRVANVSSASIPLVISENVKTGKFKKGDVLMCPAIGSGIYYGAILLRL